MKKIIANFLIAVVLLTGLSASVLAKPASETKTNLIESETNAMSTVLASVFRVRGYKTRWHKVYLEAGSYVDIELNGNGNTNLDLYVYGSSNTPIIAKTGSSDYESGELEIYRSGYFWVGVVNRGSYSNDYELTVDEY
jgi:hypothetical protein